ncbi:DMT family transporter [Brenneria sp. hezel4-2-4]|nr:DMT family transporter [Brenneria sp. hezel4-2-4]NPD01265.1 DMT family transporter [Brenneria sp. hezel4-2-4]
MTGAETVNTNKIAGIVYALLAAIFNGTVGVLSVKLFQTGLSPAQVAFYKCLIGLAIIFVIIMSSARRAALFHFIKSHWHVVLICSFFGFFMLYHFETSAYSTTNVATVVFMLFGTATVFSFMLSAIAEKRLFSWKEIQAITLSIVGLYLIFSDESGIELSFTVGLINAMLAGIGYGLFLFLSKKLKLGAGMPQMCTLLLFGSIYLYFPVHSSSLAASVTVEMAVMLLLLAILPTIGGFWCTTKALTLTSSQSVQLIELSEPVFAILFSAIFLGQLSSPVQYIGGALIFLAILLHEFSPSRFLLKKARY